MKSDVIKSNYAIFFIDEGEYRFIKFTNKINNDEFKDNPAYVTIEIDKNINDYEYVNGISTAVYNKSTNKAYIYTDMEVVKIFRDNKNREDRKIILQAFDIWEKAVVRGREEDSNEIMQWYHDIFDLKEEAFENIPDRIKYYMGGK